MAKLEKLLLFLLIVLLPSQLGYYWWPDWILVNGIRIDYLSPALYLTDILIFGLLIIRFPRSSLNNKFLLVSATIIFINIVISGIPSVSLWGWVKIGEALLLAHYVHSRFSILSKKWWVRAIAFSIIWTGVLTVTQVVDQKSAGGIWYWLGERTFSVATPGIAKVAINGVNWLRPYASLPHPNALAGYLFLAQGLILLLSKNTLPKPWWISGVFWLSGLLILLTLSRVMIFLEILTVVLFLIKSKKALILLSLVGAVFILPGNPLSLTERIGLAAAAKNLIYQNPLMGVGLNNFIPSIGQLATNLPYQPVHNIFLLMLAELGVPLALLVMGIVLIKILKLRPSAIALWLIIGLVVSGTADHYWITLHQNILLLAMFAGLVALQLQNHE